MRGGSQFARFCSRYHPPRIASRSIAFQVRRFVPWNRARIKRHWTTLRSPHPILLAATLSPLAFIQLSEEDHKDGRSGEEQMLEASREEMEYHLPDDCHGLNKLFRTVWMILDLYIYEPLATGARFLHLVVIFVPVIVTVPAIWLGKRQKERDAERTGTLWWYSFLVNAMERAGPAFIKVGHIIPQAITTRADIVIAGTMGGITD